MFSLFTSKKQTEPQEPLSPKRKPLSEIFYEQKAAKLPQDFAQSIMELEMQLEFPQSYSLEVVMKLNELYRIAIQHYINDDSRKANHFQRKLTTLLTNPQTLALMDQKTQQNKNKRQREKVKEIHGEGEQHEQPVVKKFTGVQYNTSLKKELNQFNSQSEIVVKSILDGSEKKVQRNHRLINHQLTGQEERLKMRLQQRSRSKKQRT